jgi:hypothetical protein
LFMEKAAATLEPRQSTSTPMSFGSMFVTLVKEFF